MLVGLLVSQGIWIFCAVLSLSACVFLYKEKVLAEKWFLLAPFLLASLLYLLLRYRLSLYFGDQRAVDVFFGGGSYLSVERWVFFLTLPTFYALTILRPDWILRVWVNFSLLVFFPLVLKLFLSLSGIAGWEDLAHQVVPAGRHE
jgi:hypothetical protein